MAEVTQDAGHNKIPGHLAGTLNRPHSQRCQTQP